MNFQQYKYVLRCFLRAKYFYSLFLKNKKRTERIISANPSKGMGIGLVYRQNACEVAWWGQINAIVEFFTRKRLKPTGVNLTDSKFFNALKERRDLDHHVIVDHKRRWKSDSNYQLDKQILVFQEEFERFMATATRHFLDNGSIGAVHFDWGPESKELYKKAVEIKSKG